MLSGVLGRNNSAILESENQAKFLQTRIEGVNRHFGAIVESFGGVARKTARLRDRCDHLALTLLQFSQSETMSSSLKEALKKFSESVAAIQDYRNCEIQRLDSRVIHPLKDYDAVCRSAAEDLKVSFASRDRELRKLMQLQKLQDKNPGDQQGITQAESRLHQASVDSSRLELLLEEQIDSFEKRKVLDLKAALKEFVNVELAFHAKSLEILSEAYKSVQAIDADLDTEEFRNSLRPSTLESRLDTARALGMEARESGLSMAEQRRSTSVPTLATTPPSTTPGVDVTPPASSTLPRKPIASAAGMRDAASAPVLATPSTPALASSLKRAGDGGVEAEKSINRVSWDLADESGNADEESDEDGDEEDDDETETDRETPSPGPTPSPRRSVPLHTSTPKATPVSPPKKPDRMAMFMANPNVKG